ncbi:MAG: 3-methyl-2-oxobutanoate hydroxymethyltransferase [Rhodospirillales bacterium]
MAQLRLDPEATGIKVNLYTGDEAAAVARASAKVEGYRWFRGVESLMVADSYLMTHLGRSSTNLEPGERRSFLETLRGLVRDVARERDAGFAPDNRPFLIADMPEGTLDNVESALTAARDFLSDGADSVKVEVHDDALLPVVAALHAEDIPVLGHIGYTPQKAENRRYGQTPEECNALFALARRVRDAGAYAMVIERVGPELNARFCQPDPAGIPIYSIFCGRASHGGQSLNVWDSVVLPDFQAIAFPPTAILPRVEVTERYSRDLIAERFEALLRLAVDGSFPAATAAAPADNSAPSPWSA